MIDGIGETLEERESGKTNDVVERQVKAYQGKFLSSRRSIDFVRSFVQRKSATISTIVSSSLTNRFGPLAPAKSPRLNKPKKFTRISDNSSRKIPTRTSRRKFESFTADRSVAAIAKNWLNKVTSMVFSLEVRRMLSRGTTTIRLDFRRLVETGIRTNLQIPSIDHLV